MLKLNIWLFDTRELNEEIPYKEPHSHKHKGVLEFETLSTDNRAHKTRLDKPPSNIYAQLYYDYRIKNFWYMHNFIKKFDN